MKIYNNISKVKYFEDAVFLHHTGSMFGIGCNAFSETAIKKIDSLKKRTSGKGFIILIPEIEWLDKFNIEYSPQIKRLFQQYWPGEVSMILKDPQDKFRLVSHNGKAAFRIPSCPFIRKFLKKIDTPIISTSINIEGKIPQSHLESIIAEKSDWFDFGILPDNITALSSKPSTLIDASGKNISCIRDGNIPFKKIESSFQKPQILFVCTANICRSPMAEYYLKGSIKKNDLAFSVRSAGFFNSGFQISENSREVLKEIGIDASGHSSTQINEELISESWLILTMTKQHKSHLLEYFPNAENKVFTLSEYAGFKSDIDDPYGMEIFYYRETFENIKERIDIIFEKIKKEER